MTMITIPRGRAASSEDAVASKRREIRDKLLRSKRLKVSAVRFQWYQVVLFILAFMQTSILYANDPLTCAAIDAHISLACPSDILSMKNNVSILIGDLQDMQYRCRKTDYCSREKALEINQALFLLEEAYKKFDLANDISFSQAACLKKGEAYVERGRKKLTPAKRQTTI